MNDIKLEQCGHCGKVGTASMRHPELGIPYCHSCEVAVETALDHHTDCAANGIETASDEVKILKDVDLLMAFVANNPPRHPTE